MEFPNSYPVLTWVVFGTIGTVVSIIFSVYLWNWLKSGEKEHGSVPSNNWTIVGMCFIYASGLMCCGIVGPPGYALSDNPELVSKDWIFKAAIMSMSIGFIGWTCILIGQMRLIKKLKRNHL